MKTLESGDQKHQESIATHVSIGNGVNNSVDQTRSSKLVNNRPESNQHKSLQHLATSSPRVQQLKAIGNTQNKKLQKAELVQLQKAVDLQKEKIGRSTVQRIVKLPHSEIDKFNRPGERAQAIASALHASGAESRRGYDNLYDEALMILKKDPWFNEKIEDDQTITLMDELIARIRDQSLLDQVLREAIQMVLEEKGIMIEGDEKQALVESMKNDPSSKRNTKGILLGLYKLGDTPIDEVNNSKNTVKLDYKSAEKDFIGQLDGEAIAYPKNENDKEFNLNTFKQNQERFEATEEKVMFEAWLYERIRQKTAGFQSEINLPNPRLVYNKDTARYGIKMKQLSGEYLDPYLRSDPEIQQQLAKIAQKLHIDESEQKYWVLAAFSKIKTFITELEKAGIRIYDLQGIIDKNGKWTIIDPLNVVVV